MTCCDVFHVGGDMDEKRKKSLTIFYLQLGRVLHATCCKRGGDGGVKPCTVSRAVSTVMILLLLLLRSRGSRHIIIITTTTASHVAVVAARTHKQKTADNNNNN